MKGNRRQRLFNMILHKVKVPECCVLPKWALFIAAFLFPIRTLTWVLNAREGFQPNMLAFCVDNTHFSLRDLSAIAQLKDGTLLRVCRDEYSSFIHFNLEEVEHE